MRTRLSVVIAVVAASLLACGGPINGAGGGGGSSGGGSGGAAGGGSGGGSTGGGSGGGAAGGGSGGGSATGGGAGGGGGSAGVPIAITFSASCPAFTPCGGNLVNNWAYTSVCVDSADPFPEVSQACPGSSFSNLAGTTQGGLYFNSTLVHRNVHTHITGNLTVAGSCALAGCASVQNALSSTFTTVTCTGSSTCDCAFTYDSLVNQDAAYVVSGSRVTTDPGTGGQREYDFCVAGSSLTYREVTNQPADPGVLSLQPM